ncbi:hypothetical protein BGP_6291 [Beggiatoa sp. PS]|nr:hypothetical protein BGP_6291 [Beggiatoa sp. PS]
MESHILKSSFSQPFARVVDEPHAAQSLDLSGIFFSLA